MPLRAEGGLMHRPLLGQALREAASQSRDSGKAKQHDWRAENGQPILLC
jgi:hypothetical protein